MKLDRITVDPARMNGQPCVRGMRLTVRRVVELAAFYPNRDELRREFPELEERISGKPSSTQPRIWTTALSISLQAMKLLLDQGLPRSAASCSERRE